MEEDKLYEDLMATSNGAIIAFNAVTLDILKEVKVNDKEISLLRNKLCNLLWEWQTIRSNYLFVNSPKTKVDCKILYSYKVYKLIDRIYNRCVIHGEEGVENTVCAVLYDVCLFSTWFLACIEGFYLGKLPKIFASDIADVNIDYIKDILKKASKRSEEYPIIICKVIQFFKENHPVSNTDPLGKPILKNEIEGLLVNLL